MSSIIYVDESGDLGWSFGAPYRLGGSSRYLTVAALCVPSFKKHIPKRVIKDLYKKFRWPTAVEKKWTDMGPIERAAFANAALKMCNDILTSISTRLPSKRNEWRNTLGRTKTNSIIT